MPISKVAISNTYDDISSIEENLDKLFETYIKPIDSIRSKAKPVLSSPSGVSENNVVSILLDDFKRKQEDPLYPQESRVHCFYRMIGMPVVAEDGSFYNPGFNPESSKNQLKRNKINSSVYQNKIQNFLYKRELSILDFENSFRLSSSPLSSIIFSLCSRHTFPFSIIDTSIDHLEVDDQNILIKDREEESFLFATSNVDYQGEILDFGMKYSNIFHPIKPFIVDPRIENVVTPDVNKICVPFLKNENYTKISKDSKLLRPGIELIIRQRLEDVVLDQNYLKNIQNILNNSNDNRFSTIEDYQTLYAAVISLSESSDLPDNIKDALSGTTSLQFKTVVKLIKTIKSCIKQLFAAQYVIDIVKSNINWVPLVGIDGPLNAKLLGKLSTSYNSLNNEVDIKITELKVRKLSAESVAKEYSNLGDFASPFYGNTFSENIKSIDSALDNLTSFRDQYSSSGFEALKNIEIIKGEVAGIGLVDILAFYVALWSIDLDVLLSLIDDESAQRLWDFNAKYRGVKEIDERVNLGASKKIRDALNILEGKVNSILVFADKYMEEVRKTQQDSNSFVE